MRVERFRCILKSGPPSPQTLPPSPGFMWRAGGRPTLASCLSPTSILSNEQEFTKRWSKRIENDPSISICVAEADGVLCGFASGGRLRVPVSYYAAELYAIYLLPAAQGNRIGRNLFAAMVDELARQELRHLLVWTLQENPSTAFYERLGGSVVANSILEIGGKKLPSIAYGWPNFAGRSWK